MLMHYLSLTDIISEMSVIQQLLAAMHPNTRLCILPVTEDTRSHIHISLFLTFLGNNKGELCSVGTSGSWYCCRMTLDWFWVDFCIRWTCRHTGSQVELWLNERCLVCFRGALSLQLVLGVLQLKAVVFERFVSWMLLSVAVFSCSVCVGISYDPPVPVLIGNKSKYGHCSTPATARENPDDAK